MKILREKLHQNRLIEIKWKGSTPSSLFARTRAVLQYKRICKAVTTILMFSQMSHQMQYICNLFFICNNYLYRWIHDKKFELMLMRRVTASVYFYTQVVLVYLK